MRTKLNPLAAASAVSLFIASPAALQAAVYLGSAYEPFAYGTAIDAGNPTSDGAIAANNGGFGFNPTGDPGLPNTTAWTGTGSVTSGSLTYAEAPYATSSGNRASLTANSVNRALAQTVDAGTLYFSYLSQRTVETNRTVNFAFFNVGSERFAIGQFGTATYDGGGAIEVSPINTPANMIRSTSPVLYGTNFTHLIVGRVVFDPVGTADELTLWVDPTSAELTNALATDDSALSVYLSGTFDIQGITNIRPFTGGAVTGHIAANADFDEIRLGTTLESVIIPEPGAAALLLLGGLGLLARRRR